MGHANYWSFYYLVLPITARAISRVGSIGLAVLVQRVFGEYKYSLYLQGSRGVNVLISKIMTFTWSPVVFKKKVLSDLKYHQECIFARNLKMYILEV